MAQLFRGAGCTTLRLSIVDRNAIDSVDSRGSLSVTSRSDKEYVEYARRTVRDRGRAG
jgi:hypothetical protein